MSGHVFPAEFVVDSLESYLGRHHRNGRVIYVAVVFCVLAGIAALPIVRIEVSSQAPGVIRPVIDTHEIRAPVSAPVAEVMVSENQSVRAGDVLIELRAERIAAQLPPIDARVRELERLVEDLERLLRRDPSSPPAIASLATREVGQEYLQYVREIEGIAAALAREQARLSRLERLHELEHATLAAVEGARFDVAELSARHALVREQHLGRWESARASYRVELRDLVARRAQLTEQRELYSIRAPIAGTIGELASLSPGSFLAAGQPLMVISPDAKLVAEVHVDSRDIAFVRPGMPVRFQVDAFDANEWGRIEGRVLAVPADVVLVDQSAIYRVRCGLGAGRLRSPDGRVGVLQKGMSLHARFPLGRRSLLELLWRDVRRWLDPYAPAA